MSSPLSTMRFSIGSPPRFSAMTSPASTMVKLNVGGRRFLTTLSTIMTSPCNVLQRMVENDRDGKMSSLKDENGYMFIDRSDVLFEVVLQYLRGGCISLDVPPSVAPRAVLRELDFYGIAPPQGFACPANNDEDEAVAVVREMEEQVSTWFTRNVAILRQGVVRQLKKGVADPCVIQMALDAHDAPSFVKCPAALHGDCARVTQVAVPSLASRILTRLVAEEWNRPATLHANVCAVSITLSYASFTRDATVVPTPRD